jgi:hypothetical protein
VSPETTGFRFEIGAEGGIRTHTPVARERFLSSRTLTPTSHIN